MASTWQDSLEGRIDFIGQQKVESLVKVVLIATTIVSFVVGFAAQSLSATFGLFGAVTVFIALLVLPPWPMFNRHPVQWLSVNRKK